MAFQTASGKTAEASSQTVPGAGLPFGFPRISPDTTDPDSEYTTMGYDSEGEVLGFSQTTSRYGREEQVR